MSVVIGHGQKGVEITFLQLQLDGTTCFQWRYSRDVKRTSAARERI